MLEKIRFNNTDFVNYDGIKKLELPQGWESVYDKLVDDNSVPSIASGYVFLDRAMHVNYNWGVLRKNNLPRPGFWSNIVDRLVRGPNRINENLRFSGFFKIKNYDRMPAINRGGYHLFPTSYSYMSVIAMPSKQVTPSMRVRIPYYYAFKLREYQIHEDIRFRAVLPTDTNSDLVSDDNLIKEKLYFELFDFLDACVSYFEKDFEYKNTAPDIEYLEGIKLDEPKENNLMSPTVKSDDIKINYKNTPSPKALAAMLAATFNFIKTDYPKDGLKDEVIIKRIHELNPTVSGIGLSQSQMCRALANGRKIIKNKS